MENTLSNLEKLSDGLLFISESEHPLQPICFENIQAFQDHIPKETKIETQHIDQFFRDAVKTNPEFSGEEIEISKKFQELLSYIKEKIENVIVYRCGEVSVRAFILGETEEGKFAGLTTTLIET